MKNQYGIMFALHLFVGIGAVVGGMAAILHPEQPLGTSLELLKNAPFQDFLIPGIILLTIIGLGNMFSAASVLWKWKFHGLISGAIGLALVGWIIIQVVMIQTVIFLHILFFFIAIVQVILSLTVIVKGRKETARS